MKVTQQATKSIGGQLLQTASFEERDGADIKLIVAALIHNVGDALAPENHSQVSATIIQPFSLDEVT